jgi:uncharacterized protein YegP (UPF0339 family)
MAAKFEIHTPKAGEYRWVLVSQGRVLATSPAYRRKGLAEKAIVSFRMAATAAPVVDLTIPAAKAPVAKAARKASRRVAKKAVEATGGAPKKPGRRARSGKA